VRATIPIILLAAVFAGGANTAPTGQDVAPPAAVPVDQEPMHRLVLKNEYVEVLHVTIPAGQSTQWHTHSHDGVAVRLTEATVSSDLPGKGATESRPVRPGDVSVAAYAKQPLTHRVNNVGPTPFEVIDVEILKRPDGPPAPPIATPAVENASARVYTWAIAPGASTPQHTHERPYLIVAASPMQLAMKSPDGASMEHPLEPGDFHWVDRKVTHVLANRGPDAGVIAEVELK
jgi:quercetin dioxygenase-like cupin family protein